MNRSLIAAMLICIALTMFSSSVAATALSSSPLPSPEDAITIVAPVGIKDQLDVLVSAYKSAAKKAVEVEYIEDSDEYRTRMTTEILTGEGPDIFAVGSIPYWDYAKRGMLVDIGALIDKDPDIDIADFRENIVDPLRDAKGRLYLMPASYRMSQVMINVPLLEKYGISLPKEWTVEIMYNVCREFSEKTRGVPGVYSTNFSKELFNTALLNEISSAIDYNKGESHADELPNSLFDYINNLDEISFNYNLDPIDMPNAMTLCKVWQDVNFSLNGLPAWIMVEHDDFEYRTFPRAVEGEKSLYYLENAFSINKNGDIDAAWEFVKFTLSKDIQNWRIRTISVPVISEPVLKSASEYRFQEIRNYLKTVKERVRKGESLSEILRYSTHEPEELDAAVEKYINTYRALMDSLGVPELLDSAPAASISVALEPGPDGKIDPTAAKAEIVRVIDIYLHEMGGDVQSGYLIIYIIAGVATVLILTFLGIRFMRKGRRTVK